LLALTELQGIDDNVTVVALDADPNEDADQVVAHIEDNGFEGTFAVSPQELTEALVAEFGPGIISPPTSPVVLVSLEEGKARLLPRGFKSVEDIQAEIEAGP
jgi:hypothetical protein